MMKTDNGRKGMNTLNARYMRTKIETASQGELILLLYDGALSFLSQGKEAIAYDDFEKKDEKLDRVEGILYELLNGLDMERGGDIAKSLHSIYLFLIRHLFEAKFNSNVDAIDDIYRLLNELKGAWKEVISKSNAVVSKDGGVKISSRLAIKVG